VSMLTSTRNNPVLCTPNRNRTLIDSPGASGVCNVTSPSEIEELNAPPNVWEGGVSKVRPRTVTVHGVEPPHVLESFIPLTMVWVDERTRTSAVSIGDGKVLMSIIRKRSRVTGSSKLLTMRRRTSSVPNAELFAGSGVKLRTRFGATPLLL